MKKLIQFILLLIIPFSIIAQANFDKNLDHLDEYYRQALADWNVPGMAVAIVKDGEVVFSRGYGTANVATEAPVDGNTLFAIASNTKAFTSTALAMLIDEGKLSWDDRVRDYLPWFRLYDPYVSESFTIRDLLTHRSGLKTFSGDLLWYGTDLDRREIVENARYLEPSFGFRAGYGYSNIMYLAAGLVIEEVSGMSWDSFVRDRILDPLDMDRTVTSTRALSKITNVSSPHNDFDDGLITIEWLNWDNIAPAGALISSVNDISKWLIFQMNKGVTADGDTLLDSKYFDQMWAAQTPQGISRWSAATWPSTHFKAYGLGWAMFDYHGKKVLGHGGGYDGFISNTTFVPEDDLAMVFLTNKNTSLYYPLKFKTLDVMLETDDTKDWSADFLALIEEREANEKAQQKKAEENRVKNSSPTLPVDKYLGTYNCHMYGNARVWKEDGQMMIHLEPTEIFVGNLTHWQYNTWKVELPGVPSLPSGLVNFIIDDKGEVVEMQVDIPNPDFDFTELKFYRTGE